MERAGLAGSVVKEQSPRKSASGQSGDQAAAWIHTYYT